MGDKYNSSIWINTLSKYLKLIANFDVSWLLFVIANNLLVSTGGSGGRVLLDSLAIDHYVRGM